MRFKNLWIEKYRPTKLDDLCIDKATKDKLVEWGNDIPHLLFVGPPGTGKTTLAQIIVKDLLKCDYLYINASDENGIDTIRTKVTGFVHTKSIDGNIKVVILDEADALTLEGQKCLRNLMESHASNARFILTGNYKHKIETSLQSRCQNLDIRPSLKEAVARCLFILKSEGIRVDKEAANSLVKLIRESFPDVRTSINRMFMNCIDGKLDITETVSNSKLCNMIFYNILAKKGMATRQYLIENEALFNSDWDTLLKDLLERIYNENIGDLTKKSMIIKIADHLEKATRVVDKEINFFACILSLEDD